VDWFHQYLGDVDALVAECRRQMPNTALFVVGHSMGGLVAFAWAMERGTASGVSGIILSSPFIGLALKVPRWKTATAKLVSRLLPGLALPTGIPLTSLTTDSAVVRETAADPLYGGPATARWFTETVAAQHTALARAGVLRLPVLFLVSTNDRLADARAARRLYEATTGAPRQWHAYPGMEHEVFNEMRREDVYRDVLAWLEQRLA
jgi:alpha-beta hydrolase superfamily lysophospholipase